MRSGWRTLPAMISVSLVLVGAALTASESESSLTGAPGIAASAPQGAAAVIASPPVAVAPGVTGLTATSTHRADPATAARVSEWMNGPDSGWIPNFGQVADLEGRAAADVLYSASVGEARFHVTTSGVSLYFYARDEEQEGEDRAPGKAESHGRPVEWARLDLRLKDAVIRPDLARREQPLWDQGERNYYLPHCPQGVLNVPAYGKVTFPEVYPGIDWVLVNERGRVHHDFVVHPGADPALIRMEYLGASAIEVSDDSRALRVRTSLGEMFEGPLHCYQGDVADTVGARFSMDGATASVIVDDYDREAPLVIDPPLLWSTYYGGAFFDGPRTIYCDNINGDIYVVGYTASSNMPLMTAGGGSYYQGTSGGGTDGFIWKFNQLGVRAWATYYGGTGNESSADCVVDASGNLYVCGYTSSTDFPTQNLGGAYNQAANAGFEDGFILKFNALGVRQWGTYYGGSASELANGITTDALGRVFVCGHTASPDLVLANPGGGAFFQGTLNSAPDAFVLRFSTLGALEWGTYLGGATGPDEAYGIATGGSSLYVTGITSSSDFPTQDPGGGAYFQPTIGGGVDAFVSRFSLGGVQTWSTYFGGDSTDYADEPVVDAGGNLFVIGYGVSSNMPTLNPGGTAYYQGALAGGFDLFLLKFGPTDALAWATFFGGSDDEFLFGYHGKPITVDTQGRLYATAMTASSDLPVLNPGGGAFYQGSFGGASDALLSRFAGDGTMEWSTYFGTVATDFGTSVSVSGEGCLFATGESWNSGTLVTTNPGLGAWYQPANAGSDDGFIAKFCVPSSACCLDFTCIPVTSQSECFALGGTAFYPGQSCMAVNCTIHCTICGRKFSDLDRNGVQEGGEPGLPGWTIELRLPSGVVYATTTTDASGNYCFNDVPCGPWTVTEAQQPGWVQVHPAGSHTLSLGTGTTQNGVNFGNYACPTGVPCPVAPPGLVARWPFDDGAGTPTATDVVHASPARNVARLQGGATGGSGELCLASPADLARVASGGQLDLDFGSGSFAIVVWMNPASSGGGPRMIVDKRALVSAAGYETSGWALYLDGLQTVLEIGTGGPPQVVPGPTVSPDTWSHVVVSVDRAAGEGRWYLNGDPSAAFDFLPIAGSVSNSADLTIGQLSPPFGAGPGFQGCIGDLALFSAPLSAAAARKAFDPGPIGWCPEHATLPAVTTFCQDQNSKQVCFTIHNNTAATQSYHWSLAGLPAGPGCSVAGPAQFSPPAGVVVVPPGSSSAPICVTIQRPVGFTAQNATSCFALTFVNDATGVCRTRTGKLRVDNSCWCATPVQAGIVGVPARAASGAIVGIDVRRPCDPVATLAYRVSATWLDQDHPDPLAVSLDGLAPGTPVDGAVTAGPDAHPRVEVAVSYPHGYAHAARYEIVLEVDSDGDGVIDYLTGTLVEAIDDSIGTVEAPVAAAPDRGARLLASPNPFVEGSIIAFTLARPEDVEMGVYDLGGRLVRSLARGRFEAGAHRLAWDGRDEAGRRAAPGVYVVRLLGGAARLEAKVVKMQ